MHLLDVRPSTVVHRNRTSPFYKNKHTYDKNITKDKEESEIDTSKDINNKTRSKSRGGNSRGRLKLIREDLEWFNSNASTEGLSDDS